MQLRTFLSFVAIACLASVAVAKPPGHDTGTGRPGEIRPGGGTSRSQDGGGKECPFVSNPEPLINFANGQTYDYRSLVGYLTSSACERDAGAVAIGASGGVNFLDKGPYRLDHYAKLVRSQDLAATERVKTQLQEKIGPLLRQYPLGPSELKPLVGQLSILSQPAAREALVELIAQDLYSTSKEISLEGSTWENQATSLASRLVVMGVEEESIQASLANYTQELAVLVQADSLGKLFTSLAAAAAVNRKVIPAFNVAAGAANSGVQSRLENYSADEKSQMLRSVFAAVRAAVKTRANVDPGVADLNEALEALLEGKSISVTSLRKLWREVLTVLTQSNTHSALASAFAESVTPNYLLLEETDIALLLQAGVFYPEIASSLQANYVVAWQRQWQALHSGKLKTTLFNEARSKIYEPMAERLLAYEPALIEASFAREIVSRSLIKDKTLEKRLPKIVLYELKFREKQERALASDSDLAAGLTAAFEGLDRVWVLGRVYYPALFQWIERHPE